MPDAKQTAWTAALRDNDVPAIKRLIVAGMDVNAPLSWDPDYPRSPPLCIAALSGQCDGVRLLLAAGADASAIEQPPLKPKAGFTYSYDSPLITAAGSGNADLVRLLLAAGADRDYCAEIRDSALHEAIQSATGKKHLEVVCLLLDRGCPPDRTPSGRSLLIAAASCTRCPGIIAKLVSRGANPNAIDKHWGCLPLHRAVEKNNAPGVQELLDGGADPLITAPASASAWSGLSPLDYAKKLKRKKLAQLLEAAAAQRRKPGRGARRKLGS
jgi:ankyrin repeat protein